MASRFLPPAGRGTVTAEGFCDGVLASLALPYIAVAFLVFLALDQTTSRLHMGRKMLQKVLLNQLHLRLQVERGK